MTVRAVVHVLHHQTDALLGSLESDGDNVFWDDIHEQEIEGLNEFRFQTRADVPLSEHIEKRSRLLIPHEERGWQEFVALEVRTYGNDEKSVYAVGSETELDKTKIIVPATHTGFTLGQYVTLATGDTDWQQGIVEFDGSKTLTFDDYLGSYTFLRRVAVAFDVELVFRIEVSGSQITGRYVDCVKVSGAERGKEIVNGKDLIAVEKTVHSDRIVSALFAIAPEKTDGTRITTTVTNYAAFQAWNRRGRHIIDIYEPESYRQDMTLEQLTQYATTELNKRIAASVEYLITAQDLEDVHPHEKVRLGDSIRIKDIEFNPPLYALARVIRIKRSLTESSAKEYVIGEVYEMKGSEIATVAEVKAMQAKQAEMEEQNAALMLMIAESQTEGDAV